MKATLALALAVALGACVAAPRAAGPRPVTDDVRAARLALGPVDDVLRPADDPRPRLRALRDLADQLDNGVEATQAAMAVVQLSRQRLEQATANGGDVARARRELDADIDAAVALAERREAWWVLSQVLAKDAVDPSRAAVFLRALDAGGWLGPEALVAAAAGARTPRERALVERVTRGDKADRTLDATQLAALGTEFVDLLEDRMFDEAGAGDLAAAVATANALLGVDPLHIDARLVIAYDADRRAGRLKHHRGTLGAVARVSDGAYRMPAPQAIAVLEHARTEAPLATSLVVAEAWAMVAANGAGDASSLLERMPLTGVDDLRDDIRGMLALEAGALATYRTWRAKRSGLASPYVAARELQFLWREDTPAQERLARESARRVVEGGWPGYRMMGTWGVAEVVASDPDVPRALREKAIAKLDRDGMGRITRHCLDAKLAAASCEKLTSAFYTLTDDESGGDMAEAAVTIASIPGTETTWLSSLSWIEPDELVELAPRIAALEGTPPGLSETWATVAVRAAIARGDGTEATRLVDTYGALLTPIVVATARLAIADLRAGVAPADAANAIARIGWTHWPLGASPADDDAHDEDEDEDEGTVAEPSPGEAQALAAALEPRHDTAAEIAAIRTRHPGADLAALDIIVALARASHDDPKVTSASLPDGVPERDLIEVLRLRHDAAAVRAPLGRYLARRVATDWMQRLVDPSTPLDFMSAMHSVDARLKAIDDAAPTDIRARAAEVLAHARRVGTKNDVQLAWLALLAGDVADARTTAADLGPASAVRRLLDDRAALPDELVRDLWQLETKRVNVEGSAIALRLLEHPGAGPQSAALACRLFVNAEQPVAAIAPCWRAWRGGVADGDVAVALTWAITNEPDAAHGAGIDGRALAAEMSLRLAGEDEATVWLNLEVWFANHGDTKLSQMYADAADRAGYDRTDAVIRYAMLTGPRAPFLRAVMGMRLQPTRSGYLERARTSLAAGDPAAARWYLAAIASRQPDDKSKPADEEMIAGDAELAARDLSDRALTDAEIGTCVRTFIDNGTLTSAFIAAHRDSALVDLYLTQHPSHTDSVAAADRLLKRFPDNRLVTVRAINTLAIHERRADAEAVLARARARHPDSALLASAVLVGGRSNGAWLATAAAFETAMTGVTQAQIAALEPVRVTAYAAEMFVPRKKVGDLNVFDLEIGGRIGLVEIPNPTRCTGAACLDAQLGSYEPSWKMRWRREVTVGGSLSAQVVFDTPIGTILQTLVPKGGRLFSLLAVIPAENGDAMLPAIRLTHDTLRPLDLVVPSDRAEALRARATMPDDAMRLAARRDAAKSGCAWVPRGLTPDQRAGVLLDVALLDLANVPRAAACADANYLSSELAVLALLSEDPAAAAFGHRVATDASYAMIGAAQTILAQGQTQASLDLTMGSERPRRAWLALTAAMPDAAREHAVDVLLGSSVPAEHASGLLIAGLLPTDATRRRLRDELLLGTAGYAQLAAEVLPQPLTAPDLAALRRRADRAAPGSDRTERRLTETLLRVLHEAGDPADRDRLARLAKRLDRDPPAPLVAAPTGGSPLSDDDLRTLALAQLVDRGEWMYARAPQPAALFAAIRDLVGRLQVSAAADQYVMRAMLDAGKGPLGILGANGGLDLTKPIECASRGFDGEYVCVARLVDAAALDRTLAAFPETLRALRAPQVSAFIGGPLSLLAGGTPLLAERAFDEPDTDGDDDDFLLGDAASKRVVYERVRLNATIGGRSLSRHLVVSASDDGRSEVEGAALYTIGDRIFVFSNLAIAEHVLLGRPAAGAALADDPAYQAELATWADGVAIQGIHVKDDERTAVTFVPEGDGLRFRVRHVDKKPTPGTRAIGLLPPGASATLAVSRGAGRGMAGDDDGLADIMGSRSWLFEHDDELAFGWYPAKAGTPEGWVMIAHANSRLERAVRTHGLGTLGGKVRAAKGLVGLRHGAYLVIGTRSDLVRAVTTRRPGGDDRNWVSHLDGHALAEAVRARSVSDPRRAAVARVMALMIDLVGSVDANSRRVGSTDVIEGVIRPPLAHAGDTRDAIDRWLTTPQLRNTTRLPRDLAPAEVERPLAFVIETADAREAARHLFPTTPRLTVTPIDDRHVRVVVTPAPALGDKLAATPLDAAARKRSLADGGDVRTSAARVQTLARELAPNGTSATDKAVRIGAWVHEHVRYEVTADGGDAVDILDRGTGDCTEYSLLTVSLLRASGVPAEIRTGVAAGGGELVAHAWVAFHDGTSWREIDPTWGRTSVGADHIETSILDFVALVSLDRLAITAVEAVSPAP